MIFDRSRLMLEVCTQIQKYLLNRMCISQLRWTYSQDEVNLEDVSICFHMAWSSLDPKYFDARGKALLGSTLDMTLEQNDARFYHKKLSEQWSGNSSKCDWPAAFLIILSNLYPCRNNAEVALPVSTSQIQLKGWSHHGSCHLEIRRFSYVLLKHWSNQILSKFSQTQPDCAVLRLLDWGSLSWSTSWRGRARKGGSLKGTSGTNLASKSTGWICSEPGSTMVWPQFMAIFLVKMMMHHFCFEIPYFWTFVWPFETPKGRFVIPKPCAWRADFSGGPPLWGSTVWQPVAGRIALQTRRLWRRLPASADRFHEFSTANPKPWAQMKMKSQLG